MSEFKGTPGPWVRRGSVIKALGGNERKVADVRVADSEGEANSRLIELAPQIFLALKDADEILRGIAGELPALKGRLEAYANLIAKASA